MITGMNLARWGRITKAAKCDQTEENLSSEHRKKEQGRPCHHISPFKVTQFDIP